MTARVRLGLFVVSGVVLLGLFGWAIAGLPGFGRYPGPYGDIMNRASVPERNSTDVVTSVNLDYRGLDTLGEEYILFVSVVAVAVLLRRQRREAERREPEELIEPRPAPARDDALLLVGAVGSAVVACFGIYVVGHGQLTPGGGFQGGAIIASGLLLVYLTAGFGTLRRLAPIGLVELGEGLGAAGFVAVGLAGLGAGATFLQNVLPLGEKGVIDSAGTMPLIYVFVGLEVAAGFSLIVLELLVQLLVIGSGRRS